MTEIGQQPSYDSLGINWARSFGEGGAGEEGGRPDNRFDMSCDRCTIILVAPPIPFSA